MPAAALATAPLRPSWRLRAGVLVLRRDATTLQVGLDPPQRVLVPDTADVRRLLDALREGRAVAAEGSAAPRVHEQLRRAGLVVPADADNGPGGPGGPDEHRPDPGLVTATQAWSGDDGTRRVRARAALRVRLDGPSALAEPLGALLLAGGVTGAAPWTGAGADAPADLVVVLRHGEPARADVDALVAGGTPHLVLGSRGGVPLLGPFVVPGTTACLRCVDAHEGEHDPRRGLLLEQAAGATPAPADPVLGALALALLARDVQRYAEGEVPLTWSAGVRVDPWGPPTPTRWPRHPCCGCAWDQAAQP